MSAGVSCWGIYRESAHSPGRVEDDAAIIEGVARALEQRGFKVELVPSEAAQAALETPEARVFTMCERGEVLDRLAEAVQAGAVVVNSPDAIRNTYRHRMVELFQRHGIPSPQSHVLATDAGTSAPLARAWIKRYDFHATQADDVMYAASEEGWRVALRRFAERGIPFVVAQQHVQGDLVKFYGVVEASKGSQRAAWFEWFYHRDKGMIGHAFAEARLHEVAFAAAAALGLEIFGGDAIIQPGGEPVIIDLNAWPSFARFRDSAARAIAELLAGRFRPKLRAVS